VTGGDPTARRPERSDGRAPVLPDRWFPGGWGLVVWSASGLGFLVLTVLVLRGATATWDSQVSDAAVTGRTPLLTHVALTLSWLGSAVPLAVWSGTAAYAMDRRFRTSWRCLLRMAVVLGLDVVLVTVLKNLVDRPRPPATGSLVVVRTLSFPSGHATATTAAVAMLLLCLAALPTSRRVRAASCAAGLLLVTAMDWSRVYLGVHYVTDVVAGSALGLWLALSTLWVLDRARRLR